MIGVKYCFKVFFVQLFFIYVNNVLGRYINNYYIPEWIFSLTLPIAALSQFMQIFLHNARWMLLLPLMHFRHPTFFQYLFLGNFQSLETRTQMLLPKITERCTS